MTIEEASRVMPIFAASRKVERALALGDPKLNEYEKELREAVGVYLDGALCKDAATETPDRKEGESMTQKEKYKRAASAMRKALMSIMSDAPDTEYRMRAARDEIQAALPYEDSDYWRVDAPAEGIAKTEEKKECAELTQEKYKKVALAMNKALRSIYRDDADVEDMLRKADAEIQAVQLSDKWGVPVELLPIEGIAVEAEKLETEDEPEKLTRAAVLEKARACVCGEREEDYGSPEDSFGCIAELWEAYLRAACISPDAVITVTPTDVAMLMALLKIARIGTSFVGGTADSFVDLAGYAACGAECAEVTV